jgi:signal transduction histidine kinase
MIIFNPFKLDWIYGSKRRIRDSGQNINPMSDTYKILFLEDNSDDVELMLHELHEAKLNFTSKHSSRKQEFIRDFGDFHPDVVLADYSLASFNGMQAFQFVKDKGVQVPFILVTGAISEKMALEFLKEGVDDFILKSSFKRLAAAIISVVSKKRIEQENQRIGEELKKSHAELRSLVKKHHVTREEERKNIAREMHDELGQILTTLKIDVAILQKKVMNGDVSKETSAEFNSIKQTIDQITKSVKRISYGLRPETIDDLGFLEAIKIQCEEFEKRNRIRCVTSLPESLSLDKDLALELYRVIQESFTNIIRHAKATRVNLKIKVEEGNLLLEIHDNGIGISEEETVSSKSLGLIGLRERVDLLNGKFRIMGHKNRGTYISVQTPIDHQTVSEYDKSYNSR